MFELGKIKQEVIVLNYTKMFYIRQIFFLSCAKKVFVSYYLITLLAIVN